MSEALQNILKNVPLLSSDEIKVLIEKLNKVNLQNERTNNARQALNVFRGKGKGVWQNDAQQFVNELGLTYSNT